MSQIDSTEIMKNSAVPVSLATRMGEIWQYRELLGNLTSHEIKVKYKNSVLGIVWTLLNPLLYLAVFSIVFGVPAVGCPPVRAPAALGPPGLEPLRRRSDRRHHLDHRQRLAGAEGLVPTRDPPAGRHRRLADHVLFPDDRVVRRARRVPAVAGMVAAAPADPRHDRRPAARNGSGAPALGDERVLPRRPALPRTRHPHLVLVDPHRLSLPVRRHRDHRPSGSGPSG